MIIDECKPTLQPMLKDQP